MLTTDSDYLCIYQVQAIFGSSIPRTNHFCPITYYVQPGAFLAGLVVPREGGLAISLTEKLEDFVSIIFLPLVSDLHRVNDIH